MTTQLHARGRLEAEFTRKEFKVVPYLCCRLPLPEYARLRYPCMKYQEGEGGKGLPRPFPRLLTPHPLHLTKRGRLPYGSRSASGTPPLTRPRSVPLRPGIYMETIFGTYSGTETVLISTDSVVAIFSGSSNPFSRLPLVLYFPVTDNSDTHNRSSMLALTYTNDASDYHLPFLL